MKETTPLWFIVTGFILIFGIIFSLFLFVVHNLVEETIETGAKIQKCQRETNQGVFECANTPP